MLQVFATAKMQMFIVRSRSEFLMIFGTGANRGPDFAFARVRRNGFCKSASNLLARLR
ncbi:unnamed protein product [Tenebrio molitor]|nr:unnamed protein product [Tenebrio molitor]